MLKTGQSEPHRGCEFNSLRSDQFTSVQFFDRMSRRGNMTDDLAENLVKSFRREQFWHGRGYTFFDAVDLAFPLRPLRHPPSKVP